MKPPEPSHQEIENALARLMPPALSQHAHEDIESMLDQLSGESAPQPDLIQISPQRWVFGIGIAASIGALIALWPFLVPKPQAQTLTARSLPSALVTESSLPLIQQSGNTASYSGGDGRVEVRSAGEGISVNLFSATRESLFQGDFSASDSLESVPAAWRERVDLLRRTLDKATVSSATPSREPQPRGVPRP
jgi:hypothetical protein